MQSEMFDDLINRLQAADVVALNLIAGQQSASVSRGRTSAASCMVPLSRSSSTEAEIEPVSLNSAGRLRSSAKRLNDATIHWPTLPFKCRIRFPMLFEAGLGRHQICSSVNGSTHSRRRGQYWSSNLRREKSRKSPVTFASMLVIQEASQFDKRGTRRACYPACSACRMW